jgi:hypothetical protein
MRLAILTLTPEAFQALMRLPPDVELIDVQIDLTHRGILKLKIQGAGWETPMGGEIREAAPATVSKSENGRLSIDWHLSDGEL